MNKGKRKGGYRGMASHELLHELFVKPQVKNLAVKLGRSAVLLYKWAQPRAGDNSGKKNPVDWVVELMQLTDERLVRWICARAGGFFVKNPALTVWRALTLVKAAGAVLMCLVQFQGRLLQAQQDGRVSSKAAEDLRAAWEELKSEAESFVQACERGAFRLGAWFFPVTWFFTTGDLVLAEA